MKIIGVIPARLSSTRLPEKVLLPINNKPLLWYVAKQASKSKFLDSVIIATDDKKIVNAMSPYPFKVVLTSKQHKSGTDRIGEIATKYKADVYINIQGDEPLIAVSNINAIANAFIKNKRLQIVTLSTKINAQELASPNNVKVVVDRTQQALYFSRAIIPYNRGDTNISYYKHIGIYGYRRNILLQLTQLSQTPLEKIEKLEQLRFLEHGFKITVLKTKKPSIGVDTKEDFEIVKNRLAKK